MTTAADDFAVEDAFEAILAGRPAPEGQAGLAAFTEAVRSSATRPGRPDAALAELLATGLLTDQSSPSVRTARSAGSPPARRPSRVRTRSRTAMILPALIAKFLSAGAVAQAATGAGVVLVAVTGVGAVGALPAPAQDTFSTVVAAVTPLDATTAEEAAEETDETSEETAPDTVPVVAPEDTEPEPTEAESTEAEKFDAVAWEAVGPVEGQPFGAWVSLAARNKDALEAQGLSFSESVRKWAHEKGFDDADLVKEGVDLDDLTEAPAEVDSDADTGEVTETEQADVAATTEVRGSRGNGNAGSNGNAGGNSNAGSAGKVDTGKAGGSGNAGNGGGNGRGNG